MPVRGEMRSQRIGPPGEPPAPPPRPAPARWWIVGFLLVCLVGVFATFGDYGITWDEDAQATYGDLVVEYFVSGFEDDRCNEYFDLKYYGALFEAGAAALSRAAGTPVFETRHLLIGLTGVLALLAVMLLGRLWRDPWVAVFAGPILLLIPRFYGHAFNNSKDIPFACGFTWAMYAIVRLAVVETVRWRDVILTGLAIGLTLSLRVGGMMLFLFLGAALVARVLGRRGIPALAATIADLPSNRARIVPAVAKTAVLIAVAWAVMVAVWPWAHQNVFLHPLQAFRVSTDFAAYKVIRFGGELVTSQSLPRSYLPWYLLITTPLATTALALVGLASIVLPRWPDRDPRQTTLGSLVLLWLFFPIVYVVLARPVIYDGIRHFLFVLPALAVLAAVGAAHLRHLFTGTRARRIATVALVVLLALPVRDLVVLHPYQSSYFNSLVGTVRKASANYDVDYWVSSYKEAAEWINERASERRGRPLRIFLAGNDRCLMCIRRYLFSNVLIRLVPDPGIDGPLPDYVDYYVSTTRRGLDQNFPDAPVLHTVGRDGAVFTVIKGR